MIAIGSDHCGFHLKKAIEAYLDEKGVAYRDYGCDDDTVCQYPVYGLPVAQAVASGECESGILLCGTGMGMAILANKVKGIRAAVCSDPYTARMSKMHNHANILTMGGNVVGVEQAKMILDEWMNTVCEERHKVRLNMISEIEEYGRIVTEVPHDAGTLKK